MRSPGTGLPQRVHGAFVADHDGVVLDSAEHCEVVADRDNRVDSFTRFDAHRLTEADFAPTELTVELLYLVEAKAAEIDAGASVSMDTLHGKAA